MLFAKYHHFALYTCLETNIFIGKSLIVKEKAIQLAYDEENAQYNKEKLVADPIYYISLLGVEDNGVVENDDYIFDTYTKLYDFCGTDVNVINAQDLWQFFEKNYSQSDSCCTNYMATSSFSYTCHEQLHRQLQVGMRFREDRNIIPILRWTTCIYSLVEFFVERHSNCHFFIDECPIITDAGKAICYYYRMNLILYVYGLF